MFKEDILKGKKILVTGGGTGLGKEMSEHYVKHGADVVICGRRESVLADTANEFKEKYGATCSDINRLIFVPLRMLRIL